LIVACPESLNPTYGSPRPLGVKNATFQTHSNKNYSKIMNSLFAIQFGRNFGFLVLLFKKIKLVIKPTNLTT
jgi:hypothetical protein